MPYDPFAADVPGDGKLTILLPNQETKTMDKPVDLPPNVMSLMQQDSMANAQANNRDGRNASTGAMAVMQFAAAKAMAEIGAIESRANSGILGTPVAAPTVPQPAA